MSERQRLPKTVRALGVVSFLTDASSEMIWPLLPSFVTSVLHAGPAFLGLVEGLAETVASALKLVSGQLSDRLARRKPLIVAGYGLSSLVRPLAALATAPWHILAVRFADRVGKGVRGAPRDALIAEAVTPDQRGRAYGFHRAMDHAGAVAGPLLAAAALAAGASLRQVFALAAVPAGLCLLFLVFGVREQARPDAVPAARRAGWLRPRGRFLRYLMVLALFTLGNSTDAFLLLRAQEVGLSLALIPLLWAFHHVVKSATSTHLGALSDRYGRRATIVAGWGVYALSYAGFALATTPLHIFGLFALYGLHFSLTDGPERALLADIVAPEQRGAAFGVYHALVGGMLLPASLLTGVLWQRWGAGVALMTGAGLAGAAAVALYALVDEPIPDSTRA